MLKVVTFFGERVGEYGMPDPFFQYAVYLTEDPAPGVSASATVTAITERTRLPTPSAFAVKQGGTDEAFGSAVAALKRLHPGLSHTGA